MLSPFKGRVTRPNASKHAYWQLFSHSSVQLLHQSLRLATRRS
jgi:hypothetical protein